LLSFAFFIAFSLSFWQKFITLSMQRLACGDLPIFFWLCLSSAEGREIGRRRGDVAQSILLTWLACGIRGAPGRESAKWRRIRLTEPYPRIMAKEWLKMILATNGTKYTSESPEENHPGLISGGGLVSCGFRR